jgi:hypothetical protein
MGIAKGIGLSVALVMASLPLAAQVPNNPGKNAEEQHAWRLYNMYRQSKETVKALESAIARGNQNITEVSYGFGGTFAVDPSDVESVRRARELIEIETGRQKLIETAWDRHFWGTYGALAEGFGQSKWDDKAKRSLDLIEWRLRNVPIESSLNIGGTWQWADGYCAGSRFEIVQRGGQVVSVGGDNHCSGGENAKWTGTITGWDGHVLRFSYTFTVRPPGFVDGSQTHTFSDANNGTYVFKAANGSTGSGVVRRVK